MCSILIRMSKRLQIIVSDEEAQRLKQCAERAGTTLSEWARRALERARASQLGPTPEQKLEALDRALQCGHPTAPIDEILSDIERGRALR
jgi:hypothetical protein